MNHPALPDPPTLHELLEVATAATATAGMVILEHLDQ